MSNLAANSKVGRAATEYYQSRAALGLPLGTKYFGFTTIQQYADRRNNLFDHTQGSVGSSAVYTETGIKVTIVNTMSISSAAGSNALDANGFPALGRALEDLDRESGPGHDVEMTTVFEIPKRKPNRDKSSNKRNRSSCPQPKPGVKCSDGGGIDIWN